MLRDEIKATLTTAMKARDKARVKALRFVEAAIKNRDIEVRTESSKTDDDALVAGVLAKLAKQHRESIRLFEEGGRADAAAAESAELAIIESFLPKPLGEEELRPVIKGLIADLDAAGPKDMGRVMAALKEKLGGGVDLRQASALVKTLLQNA